MKKLLLLWLICLPLVLSAQTDKKYLEGAISVIDGKVTFKAELNAPNMSQEQIYDALLHWANNRYQPDEKHNDRVLYQNKEEGNIVIGGEEYIIFSTSALSMDRTRIYYQMRINCQPNKCDINISRIKYWYDEARDGGVRYVAEEWITDKYALNKNKTKLYPISGKFRTKTIDWKDQLISEIRTTLGNKMLELGVQAAPVNPATKVTVAQPQTTPKEQPLVTLQPATPIQQPQAVQPTTSDNIESLIAQAERMTITAGNDEQFEISKECWGGFGELFGKKVAFCLIDTQKTMGNMLMTQSENYKISFYSANNNQPSAIILCKKLMAQTINGEEAQKMSPSCIVGKSYNMYVGEILK